MGEIKPRTMKELITESLVAGENVEIDMNSIVCRFYAKGNCTEGYKCLFPHVQNSQRAAESACRFYLQGRCVHGKSCWYDHVVFKCRGRRHVMQIEGNQEEARKETLLKTQKKTAKDYGSERSKMAQSKPSQKIALIPASKVSKIEAFRGYQSQIPLDENCALASKIKSELCSTGETFYDYNKNFPPLAASAGPLESGRNTPEIQNSSDADPELASLKISFSKLFKTSDQKDPPEEESSVFKKDCSMDWNVSKLFISKEGVKDRFVMRYFLPSSLFLEGSNRLPEISHQVPKSLVDQKFSEIPEEIWNDDFPLPDYLNLGLNPRCRFWDIYFNKPIN